jgi:hypothetical protein
LGCAQRCVRRPRHTCLKRSHSPILDTRLGRPERKRSIRGDRCWQSVCRNKVIPVPVRSDAKQSCPQVASLYVDSKFYQCRGCPLVHQPPPRPTARRYPNLAPSGDLSVIGPPMPPAIIVKGRVARIRLAWVHRLEPLTIRFLSPHQAPIRRFYDDRNANVDDRRLVGNPATVNVWLTGEPDDRLPLR